METKAAEWFVGKGEMAQRIRVYDWAATPLGPIVGWPSSLRTALTMVLDHPLPMVLGWGTELIALYNDAYLPLLGKKADALGRPLLEVWKEAHEIVAPQIASTLAGETHRFENAPFTLLRGDRPEKAFFDYSLSPVRDETGAVVGILNTAFETTARVLAAQKGFDVTEGLRESEARFRALVTAGTYSVYRMSPDWRVMYQLDSEILANTADPIENWIDKYIPAEDRPSVSAAIEHAVQTKSLFELEHRVRLADGSTGWVVSRAVPRLGSDGVIQEWFGAGSNVTDRRRATEQLREHEERHRSDLGQQVRERTAELKASHDLFQASIDSSLDMIQVFEAVRDEAGDIVDFRWVLNNHTSESKYGEVRGESLLQRNLGVVEEGIFDTFKRVAETGIAEQAERHYVHEQFDSWFYQSVVKLGDGVATTTKDIGDWKAAQAEVLRLQEEVAQAKLRKSEDRQALLLRLSDALRTTVDSTEMQVTAMRLLGEHLGLSRAYYFDVERKGDTWIHVTDSAYQRELDGLSMIGRHALSHFGDRMFEGFDRGEVVAVADVDALATLTPEEQASYHALGVTAFINVPLLRNGEYSAGIGAHDTGPHTWTQSEIDLIREVAERTWTAVERVRAEVASRESDARFRTLFDSMNEGFAINVLVRDGHGSVVDARYVELNPAYEKQTGFDRASSIGRLASEIYPAFLTEWLAACEEVVRTGQPDRFERYVADNQKWFVFHVTPFAGVDHFAVFYDDITQKKLAEALLQESEKRQSFLLKLSDEIRAQPDEAAVAVLVTHQLAKHLELDRCYLAQLFSEEDRVIVGPEYRRPDLRPASGEYRLSDFPEVVRRVQSQTVVFNDVAGDPALTEADKVGLGAINIGAFITAGVRQGDMRVLWSLIVMATTPRVWTPGEVALVEDVAERTWAAMERVRTEAALRETEERLTLAFTTLPVGMAIIDQEGGLLLSNQHMQRFLSTGNIPSRDLEQLDRWEAFDREGRRVQPRDFPSARALRGETVSPGMEMVYWDDNNAEIWTEVLSAPLRDREGRIDGALSVVIDVDRRKRSEEAARASNEQLRLFVENVREYALMQTNPTGEITSWNAGAQRMFGYTSAEVLGQSFSMMLTPEDYEGAVFLKELDFVGTGTRSEDARWMVRKDGSRFWARWVTEPVYETDGRFRGLAKVMRDETDRQRADEAIRASLAEKEELLKEVHHRVKNNLQVIVSLLNMQGSQIHDERVLAHFQEARNRVLAISSIHELLYRAESFAGIPLTDYARELVPGLVRFYGLESRVQVNILGDGNKLELERAVPFGILLNELVSNACKHAFPAPSKGTLTIEVRPESPDIALIVSDDGKGLPDGFDYRKASSLGLKLVHALARQLRGTVLVSSGGGTTVTVTFPANATRESK